MRRQGSVRGPVRRTVLTAAIGLLAAGAAGCGLRLDRDPQMPALSPVDVLRDAVARILAATQTDDGTAAAIRAFAEAVGPPWNPPAHLDEPVEAPNPDPPAASLTEGLVDLTERIVDASTSLGPGTDPTFAVLADVAVGSLLLLDSHDAEAAAAIRSDLAAAMREVLDGDGSLVDGTEGSGTGSDGADSGASGGAWPAGNVTVPEHEGDDVAHPLTALITACYTGVYAYERAAVHLPDDDEARRSAHTRIDRLHAMTATAATLEEDVAVPSDRPAWELPVSPRDGSTAREALRIAEDGLVAVLADAQGSVPPAVFLSWLDDSGRARRRAEGSQDLRLTVVPRSDEEDG
ncbi:hypothetical protein [Brevibacterium yomogidense]|uniref:hypothetical protein n=1 Tax=Brevibacterium yomogidense TaxID=946573 RepID=UPI0018DF111A|nr:hypothetical protein [Brevibacterium yomogidense]